MRKGESSNAKGNGERKAIEDSPLVICEGCGAPIRSKVVVNACVHCRNKDEQYPKGK